MEKGLSSCIAVCLSRVSAECRPAHESESASLLRMGGGAQADKVSKLPISSQNPTPA